MKLGLSIHTAITVLLCLLLLSQSSHAFDWKSLLFGDQSTSTTSRATTRASSFGKPVTEYSRSSRPEDMSCRKYLCEDTEDCVDTPIDCPCRLMTDKKCIIGDWYTCIRGDELCKNVV